MGIELRCLFSGHVQGVGFRWRTQRTLEGRGLDGYVRNLMDGRVELRVQGEEAHVREAVRLVEAAMSSHITDVQVEEREIDEQLGAFRIR